jgi:hypothetical protein
MDNNMDTNKSCEGSSTNVEKITSANGSNNANTDTATNITSNIPLNMHEWHVYHIALEVLLPPRPMATPPYLLLHGESEISALTLPPPAFHRSSRDGSTSNRSSAAPRIGPYLAPAPNVLPAAPTPAVIATSALAVISSTPVVERSYHQETLAHLAYRWLRRRGDPWAFGGRGPIDLENNLVVRRVSHAGQSSVESCRDMMHNWPNFCVFVVAGGVSWFVCMITLWISAARHSK